MADFDIKKYYKDIDKLFKNGTVVRQRVASKIAAPGDSGVPVGTARAFLKHVNNSYTSALASYGQYSRLARYSDYNEMESMAEIGGALDLYAEEVCSKGDNGELIKIESSNPTIRDSLTTLFYDVLNIEFNAFSWIRNMCKYGDQFLLIDHHPDYGVLNALPLPVNEIEREEGYDKDNPLAYRYRWITQGNRSLENWQVIHFRLLGNDNFLPYGGAVLEPARRVWRQLILMEDAVMVYRVVRSPERRVFYIGVGNVAPQDIPSFVEKAKTQLKRNQIVDTNTGRVDLRYNPMCHSLKTEIFLQDGRTITLDDLIAEWNDGHQGQWVYSIDRENNALVPGKVIWAGVTRKSAQIVRIHLDDNGYVDVTPDHEMMLRNKEYVEAQNLKPGDALMPLYRKDVSRSRGQAYWKTYDPFSGKYVFDHRMVSNSLLEEERLETANILGVGKNKFMVVHHKDFNAHNNNPENLTWMGNQEHAEYHRDLLVSYNKSAAKRAKTAEDNKKYQKAQRMGKRYNGSVLHHSHNGIRKSAQLCSWAFNYENRKKSLEWIIPDRCMAIGQEIYRSNPGYSRDDFLKEFKNNNEILSLLKENNKIKRDVNKISRWPIEKKLRSLGFVGFKEYKAESLNTESYKNHTVLQVEWREDREDTGCITVEKYHNFAVASIGGNVGTSSKYSHSQVSGIFTKNSTDEDYFIPVRGEGDGTKIDTLPGGQFTGDIDDLVYIQNKLFAALKVPKSYLGYEGDIGSKSTLSQEDVRFARTIQRIQRVFISELNKIAVLHLYSMGLSGEELINFEISMANPSTISELQRLELWRTKLEVASVAQEGTFDKHFIYNNLFKLSDDEIAGIEEGRRKDRLFDLDLESIQPASAAIPSEPEAAPTPEAPASAEAGLPPPPGEAGAGQEVSLDTAGKDPNMQSAAPNELTKVFHGKKENPHKIPDLRVHAFGTKKTAMDPKRNYSELTRMVRAPFGESVEEEAIFNARTAQLKKFAEELDGVEILRSPKRKKVIL
jgi:hypothetical protein